jgi:hypothetical protein
MNPQRLYTAEGTPTVAWLCGHCGNVHADLRGGRDPEALSEHHHRKAEECCTCMKCGKPGLRWHDLYCDDCYRAESDPARRVASHPSRVVADWTGPVWWPDFGPEGCFFHSLESLLVHLESVPTERRPAWVFAAEDRPFSGFDATAFLDEELNYLPIEIRRSLQGLELIRLAVDGCNALNAGLTYRFCARDRVVAVPPRSGPNGEPPESPHA